MGVAGSGVDREGQGGGAVGVTPRQVRCMVADVPTGGEAALEGVQVLTDLFVGGDADAPLLENVRQRSEELLLGFLRKLDGCDARAKAGLQGLRQLGANAGGVNMGRADGVARVSVGVMGQEALEEMRLPVQGGIEQRVDGAGFQQVLRCFLEQPEGGKVPLAGDVVAQIEGLRSFECVEEFIFGAVVGYLRVFTGGDEVVGEQSARGIDKLAEKLLLPRFLVVERLAQLLGLNGETIGDGSVDIDPVLRVAGVAVPELVKLVVLTIGGGGDAQAVFALEWVADTGVDGAPDLLRPLVVGKFVEDEVCRVTAGGVRVCGDGEDTRAVGVFDLGIAQEGTGVVTRFGVGADGDLKGLRPLAGLLHPLKGLALTRGEAHPGGLSGEGVAHGLDGGGRGLPGLAGPHADLEAGGVVEPGTLIRQQQFNRAFHG